MVLWSPRQRIYQTEKFSEMFARNHTFFLREQRSGVSDWIVLGVSRSAEGAAQIRMQAGQKLSEQTRTQSKYELEKESEALDAEIEAYESGFPLPPKPKTLPWWISDK